jgi:hypothetical protein
MIRRQLVGAALTLVVIAVIGLLYLQTIAQSRATRDAWMLTHDVVAGALLGDGDVRHIRVPAAGDQFTLLDSSPLHRRAAHRMSAQTLLTPYDLLDEDTVQVPVSVRVAPGVADGDTLDVYAVVGGRTVLVGRRLIVAGAGNPMTLLVGAADEPNWIALEANNVSLFAAKSSGVGVPQNPAVAVGDAISSLSGTSQTGGVLAGTGQPSIVAAPAPTPPPPTATPRPR